MAFIQRQDNVSSGGGGGGGVVTGAAQGVELNGSIVELADAASPVVTKTIQLTGSAGNNFVVTSFDDFAALANGDASLISGAGGGAGDVLIQSLGSGDVEILSGSNVISTNADEISFSSVTGVGIFSGTGSPEGVVTASPGSMYLDRTAGWQWVKLSGTGNTGWNRIAETMSIIGVTSNVSVGNPLSFDPPTSVLFLFTPLWDAEITAMSILVRGASLSGTYAIEANVNNTPTGFTASVTGTGGQLANASFATPPVSVSPGDFIDMKISSLGAGAASVVRGVIELKRR